MSAFQGETAAGCSEAVVLCDTGKGIARKLVMRPKGFFSREFHMVVEDEDAASGPFSSSGLGRIFSPKRFALAALIGVPILIYGVAS